MLDIEAIQSAASSINDGISISDYSLEGNPLIFVNAAFERMTGYSFQEVVGQNCRFLQGTESKQEDQLNILREAVIKHQPCIVTLRNYRKDGSMFWNELSLTPLLDCEGKLTHYLGIQKDVSDRIESLARLEHILEGTNAGTWDWDIKQGSLHTNKRWADIIGYELDEVEQHIDTWQNSLHPDDLAHAEAELKLHFSKQKDYYDVIFRQRHKLGHYLWVNARGKVVQWSENDEPLRMSGVHIDVTEQKLTEQRLRLIAKSYEHAREGIFITDTNGLILETNEAFSHLTGYTQVEVIGQTLDILKSGMQSPDFYKHIWSEVKDEGYWSGEMCNRHKNGQLITKSFTISSVFSSDGEIENYIAIFSDITMLKEHNNRIKKVTYFDQLTGLPNQKLLTGQLDHLIALKNTDEQFTIINLDLDNLAQINKKFNFNTGDALILETVERLKTLLSKDDILSCIGGDSFIIVLTEKKKPSIYENFYDELKATINEPCHIDGNEITVSASIGIAFFPQDGVTSDILIRNSGQALFKAKLEGKDCYQLFDSIENTNQKNKHIELKKLKTALQNNEFVLYYQPKVDMRNADIIGFEALIRWQHPERGLVYPDEIFPLVADDILNIDIGEWVIEAALKQLSSWHGMGIILPISVNIDGIHLQQTNFISKLEELLASYPDVPASSIELEVLETNSLEDVSLVSALLEQCRTVLGIKSSIDDFGTGYSSLTYLKQLPVDMIKIDQSFIRDMFLDESDLAIIKGIVGLADAFKTKVIAEGVETIEHAKALVSLNCYLGQGYGIARPMPASEVPLWIEKWNTDEVWCKS